MTLAVGLPSAASLAFFYLASVVAQAPGDSRRLFWYATTCALVAAVWGPLIWTYHRVERHVERHDDRIADEIADLRCTNRRLEDNLEDLAYALADLPVDHGVPDLPPPAPRLRVVPTPGGE
jgi:hypothetical protein